MPQEESKTTHAAAPANKAAAPAPPPQRSPAALCLFPRSTLDPTQLPPETKAPLPCAPALRVAQALTVHRGASGVEALRELASPLAAWAVCLSARDPVAALEQLQWAAPADMAVLVCLLDAAAWARVAAWAAALPTPLEAAATVEAVDQVDRCRAVVWSAFKTRVDHCTDAQVDRLKALALPVRRARKLGCGVPRLLQEVHKVWTRGGPWGRWAVLAGLCEAAFALLLEDGEICE